MKTLMTTMNRFRGVIQPMTKSGWFRPVAKDYRKQKREFVLVNRPGGRRVNVALTFAPAIRLTAERTDFLTRIFPARREFSSSQQTKIREVFASLFSTLSGTVREITRSWSHEKSFHAKTQSRKESSQFFLCSFAPLRENTFTTTRALNQFTHIIESKLFTSSKTTHQHHDRWLLLRSKNTETESSSTTNVLSLNFASRKVSETELLHQHIARFTSSPELTYAKRQQAMSEGIVQALRGLRTPDQEPKRIAAPALPSIEQITNQVKTQLERELRIERERRGL